MTGDQLGLTQLALKQDGSMQIFVATKSSEYLNQLIFLGDEEGTPVKIDRYAGLRSELVPLSITPVLKLCFGVQF